MRTWRLTAALGAVLLSAACAGTAPPSARAPEPLTWLAYLNGDDMRRRCLPGEDRYRLVFNPDRPGEPVRIIEIAGNPRQGATIEARHIGVASVAEIAPGDRLAAWDGRVDSRRLSRTDFIGLSLVLAERGVFSGVLPRLELGGSQLRWFASGCHQGTYFLSAYAFPPGVRQEAALRE
ncbi:MAG TPA: hypothetical protein VEB20_06640 [Azospirillaceae bacterium]|nr:hypothetical protein [Azospirillaceae bacterium]